MQREKENKGPTLTMCNHIHRDTSKYYLPQTQPNSYAFTYKDSLPRNPRVHPYYYARQPTKKKDPVNTQKKQKAKSISGGA